MNNQEYYKELYALSEYLEESEITYRNKKNIQKTKQILGKRLR
ncbi:unnamed protein product [Paramecium sonneborni]|uniref:Uncharacterized protein n=1 Tax=Paramecium sonneborni TaxID=65129 RepID=A0A8S1R7B5_9CILI|nr:unnamed protein product [Paramecium sonneborni]